MSSGVVIRRQETDTAANRAVASRVPLAPLVSWKGPWPSSAAGACPMRASTGTRLASDSPRPGTVFRAPPPEVAATTPTLGPVRL